MARVRDERGVAAVLGVSLTGVLLLVSLLALSLARSVALQHTVDSAADLAAISGLETLRHGGDPCHAAAVIATADQATLARCRVDGYDVLVVVVKDIRLPFGLGFSIRGRAHALLS